MLVILEKFSKLSSAKQIYRYIHQTLVPPVFHRLQYIKRITDILTTLTDVATAGFVGLIINNNQCIILYAETITNSR